MQKKFRSLAVYLLLVFIILTRTVSAKNPDNTSLTYNLWENIPYNFVVPQIEIAQKFLIDNDYLNISSPTGFYGSKTKIAVAEYQRINELEQNGVIGSLTRRLMNKNIINNSRFSPDPVFKRNGNFESLSNKSGFSYTKELQVPLIEQQYPLSCEAASLQMALSYKGIEKSQDELIEKIGVSEPKEKYIDSTNSFVWGDPSKGFVGNIKGWMYNNSRGMISATGWGVNKDPVANIAKTFRPESFAMTGGSIEKIISEISNDNPVIVWQYSRLPESLLTLPSYKTLSGDTIKFIPTHVNVVVGFRKNTDGQYTFLINDPEYGRIEIDQKSFDKNWSKYNRDMVVIR